MSKFNVEVSISVDFCTLKIGVEKEDVDTDVNSMFKEVLGELKAKMPEVLKAKKTLNNWNNKLK